MTNCRWQTVPHDWPDHRESSVAKFRPRTWNTVGLVGAVLSSRLFVFVCLCVYYNTRYAGLSCECFCSYVIRASSLSPQLSRLVNETCRRRGRRKRHPRRISPSPVEALSPAVYVNRKMFNVAKICYCVDHGNAVRGSTE